MANAMSDYLELRKDFLKPVRREGFNNWLAVKITDSVGTMWCAYAFAGLALISLPEAIKGGTGPLIAWIAQTFLQLVLLSIIMVGQRVQSEKSDRQLNQTYKDAEQLLRLSDQIHTLVRQNAKLTKEINQVVCADNKGRARARTS